MAELADCPNREQHTAQPEGYLAASEWAGEMQKTHRQIRCKGCNRWAIWIPRDSTQVNETNETGSADE